MWRIVLFLIFTLIVVPVVAFQFDSPPTNSEWAVLNIWIKIYIASSVFCFAVSTVTKNYSQVDKLWSILPIIYAWVAVYESSWDGRLLLMATLVTIWGSRLSYNFWRRGGFQWKFWEGEEDYRWAILMAKPEFQPHWKWVLFNFFFISFYQLGLIMLFTIPMVKSIAGRPLNWVDGLIALGVLFMIIFETVADQQQWNYQNEKHEAKEGKRKMTSDYEKGFLDAGLWGIVRHPNYAAEQGVWILFYLFSVTATGLWINWSIMGALLLILLFKGSSDFSEEISASKYPNYSDYQKKVPRFIPDLY